MRMKDSIFAEACALEDESKRGAKDVGGRPAAQWEGVDVGDRNVRRWRRVAAPCSRDVLASKGPGRPTPEASAAWRSSGKRLFMAYWVALPTRAASRGHHSFQDLPQVSNSTCRDSVVIQVNGRQVGAPVSLACQCSFLPPQTSRACRRPEVPFTLLPCAHHHVLW